MNKKDLIESYKNIIKDPYWKPDCSRCINNCDDEVSLPDYIYNENLTACLRIEIYNLINIGIKINKSELKYFKKDSVYEDYSSLMCGWNSDPELRKENAIYILKKIGTKKENEI